MSDRPIAIIDSGVGGLAVVRHLRAGLPQEKLIYFGDTARTPYGSKAGDTVLAFVRQIVAFLTNFQPKHVLIACNTASALVLPRIKTEFPGLPISGVIDPCARSAVEAAGSKSVPLIGILATEATIWSKSYERAIHRRRHYARLLLRPAPLLVPLVEEGRAENDAVVKLALQQYLHPISQRGADVLILGCTHYTLLREQIARLLGERVALIDSSQRGAEDVARRLQATGLLRSAGDGGDLRCFVTDDAPRFRTLARRFLGSDPGAPTRVAPEDFASALEATIA